MFSIIISFINEQSALQKLIVCLNNQIDRDFRVVFVDNGSSDQSSEIIQNSKNYKFECIRENKRGVISALRSGVQYVFKNTNDVFVARLDADNLIEDKFWSGKINKYIKKLDNFSYIYGPFDYNFSYSPPVFKLAYSAYSYILRELMEKVGWFATTPNAVYPLKIINEILSSIDSISSSPEEDLKMSLYSLHMFGYPHYISSKGYTCGDRLMSNMYDWCFYNSRYYYEHWQTDKNSMTKFSDLKEDQIDFFFKCRSQKLVVRNLMPIIMFEQEDRIRKKLERYTGLNISLPRKKTQVLINILWNTAKFESLITKIGEYPVTKGIVGIITAKMRGIYLSYFHT